ncbi:PH domain-containing protein [Alkalicoccus daliensis]|uniref:PH domain-containing protein n=1 Tax=Alkalicoccus daliensis TaxID=745820 RepID=A0A1H0JZT2_9BACI|nr:PH domain-containing protein [Alkalicoccus daliensis]SDO49002.1 PH domain-containing protein [Alkalicoccus daliensis]
MTYQAKRDSTFTLLIIGIILLTAASCFLPVIFTAGRVSASEIIILSAIFIFTSSFVLWISFSMSYALKETYLHLQAGPIKKKISYKDLTEVKQTKNILIGFRLLSSKDALELFYKTSILGSVKISPARQEEFVTELLKRAPHMKDLRNID